MRHPIRVLLVITAAVGMIGLAAPTGAVASVLQCPHSMDDRPVC